MSAESSPNSPEDGEGEAHSSSKQGWFMRWLFKDPRQQAQEAFKYTPPRLDHPEGLPPMSGLLNEDHPAWPQVAAQEIEMAKYRAELDKLETTDDPPPQA